MASELLVNSLKELIEAELKEFHWHLKNAYNKCISKSEMEKADIFDTVDKMVACFGAEEAVKVMVEILRKMNQNDLAEQLENEHKQAQTEGNMKTSVTAEVDSQEIWKNVLDEFQPKEIHVVLFKLHKTHSSCKMLQKSTPGPTGPDLFTPLPSQHIHVGPIGVVTGAHLGYPFGTQLILSTVSMVATNVLAQMG
ncbi:hypothetical protein QQF64_036175 [Cirrhinus molitorella]|uniref:Pyrin domain-containing protein n=1 Tax=Cirrhinus molitorella TaxID=172907 RepID=A0ABR3NIG8_9TELE